MNTPHWLTVRNEAAADEIIISGQIGKNWWDDSGVSEKEFRDALDAIPKYRHVTIGINSEGGSVQDGLGIYNAIKRRGNTSTRVDGYALSIASIIALAGDRVISPRASVWMIHEPWAWAQGNAEDMRRAFEMLNTHGETIAGIYADETGRTKDEARSAMKSETWFTGEEAAQWGLADETTSAPANLHKLTLDYKHAPPTVAAIAGNVMVNNLSPFRVVRGSSLASATEEIAQHNEAKPKGTSMTKLLSLLAEANIIPTATLDEDSVVKIVSDYLDTQAEKLTTRDQRIAELEAAVTANKKAHAEALIDTAVKEGRVKDDAALRQRWVDALVEDPEGAGQMLASIPAPKPAAGLTPEEVAKTAAVPGDPAKPALAGYDKLVAACQKQAEVLLGIKRK